MWFWPTLLVDWLLCEDWHNSLHKDSAIGKKKRIIIDNNERIGNDLINLDRFKNDGKESINDWIFKHLS